MWPCEISCWAQIVPNHFAKLPNVHTALLVSSIWRWDKQKHGPDVLCELSFNGADYSACVPASGITIAVVHLFLCVIAGHIFLDQHL